MLSSGYSYGRGTRRFPFYGRYSHGHYGLIDGFHSALLYFPEDDMSLAVSVNGLALNFNSDIVVAVLNIYYGRYFKLPNYSHQSVAIDEKLLSEFVGDYHFQSPQNPGFKIDTSLFIKKGQLFGSMPDFYSPDGMAFDISFIATSENTFFNRSEGIQLTFEKTWYGTLDSDRFKAKHNGVDYYFQKK
jgi:hypothetical protein